MQYKYSPARGEAKTPAPTAPMMNAGPELLQKPISRSASSADTLPARRMSAMYAAPSG